MKTVCFIIILPLLLYLQEVKAQDKIKQFHASGTYHYGYILAHRTNVQVLVKDYSKAFELNFEKQMTGGEEWHEKYAYPFVGVGAMLIDFGNPEQLGNGFAIFGYYNFPIVRMNNLMLSFKLGLGPGYVQNIFDKKENYKNYTVSTHFNGFAYGNLMFRYVVKDRLTMNAGLSISHFSNAAARKPNLGINVPAVNVGMGYKIIDVEKTQRGKDHSFTYPKKYYHDFVASFGRKANDIEGAEYGIFTLAYTLSKHVSYKSRFGLGTDVFYNSAHNGLHNTEGEKLDGFSDVLQLGAHASYTLQVNRMDVFINMGLYVYDHFKDDGSVYNRVGFRYAIQDHFLLNISMKTHYAVADHVEFGFGYRL